MKLDPPAPSVGMQNRAATVETCMEGLKKPNNPRTIKAWNYHMTQKPCFRGYIQKN